MRNLLSRTTLLAALLMVPGCASLPAQDPEPYENVRYSSEELDNLVAPVALYPDALLAQILVAATFPDQIADASRYVRERGTRNIDSQNWDISVKAVAYYPPILNMLANQDDWSIALGQAYASQSGDVMDAVQRLREMAREQGNLVTTREHVVTEDRGRIVIVPANPQVIYVPTYDPYVVYYRPIVSFGFHTGYFSFGVGFPIGSWLVYDCDWWTRRVYYDGWYDGWRYRAARYFTPIPVYYRPRYSVVNININIFSRRVNYINLDRRYRYVRRDVDFVRHDRGGRYADRDGYRDRDGYDRDGYSRDGYNRDGYARDGYDRQGYNRDGYNRDGYNRDGRRNDSRGPIGETRSGGGRDRGNDRIGNRTANFDDFRPDRGGNGSDARDAEPRVERSGFGVIEKRKEGTPQSRSNDGNGRSATSEERGSRPNVPIFRSQPRTTEKSNGNSGRRDGAEIRSAPRPQAPVFRGTERSVERPSRSGGGNSRPQNSDYRSAPRPNAPVFSAPQRSAKSGGNGGGGQVRSAPSRQSSGSSARSSGGAGGGKVKASGAGGGGNPRGGGGKGRKQ